MTNENTVGSNQTPDQPSPQLQAVPGYQTTSGQFTALFTVVALFLGLLGFHYSPDQVESWVALVNKIAVTLGPILAIVPVLWNYVNSRGKIASNTLMANATVLAAKEQGPSVQGELISSSVGFAGGLGLDFKNPDTYQQLLHIAGELGVPGAHQADSVSQQIPVTQLITGILGMFHKKAKAIPATPLSH